MLKILFKSCFLVTFFWLSAQNQQEADSLKTVLYSNDFSVEGELDLLRMIAFNETNPVETKKFAERLIEKAKKNKTVSDIYNGYYFLGQAERRLGNPLRSLDNFFECRKYADELTANAVCESSVAIADVYSLIPDYANAVRYYVEGINAFEDTANLKLKDISTLALACINLGDTYFLMDSLDQALVYFAVSGRYYQRLDNEVGQSYNNGNIGLVYAKMGQYNRAEDFISKAAESLRKLDDYYSVSTFYTYLADIFYEKDNFPKALEYAEQSYSLAKQYNLKEQLRDAHLKLYKYHKQLNDFDKALFHHENYLLYKDSISNVQTVSQIANLRTEFEVGQKQAEVDLLTAEKRTQQIITWAIAAFALILIVLASIIYKYYQAKAKINAILESQKFELERLNETKDKFFSIISHDLRGPISAFQGVGRMIKFALKNENKEYLIELSDDIDESAGRLSSLLDGLLAWALQQQGHFPNVPEKVVLNNVVTELTAIFKNTATSKGVNLSTDIEDHIALWVDKNTTQTIIRNLLNNALKFTPEGGDVTVYARFKETMALIEVRDTGVGIPKEKLDKLFNLHEKKSTYGTSGEKGLGLGLQLVYEFIEMNNGTIEVQSLEGKGSVFRIQLPLFQAVQSLVEH